MFEVISVAAFALSVLVAFTGGLLKGMIGFGLPLIMISGLSSFLDPKLALAGMLFSVVVTNVMQVLRTGLRPAFDAARAYWRYILTICVSILVSAQLVNALSAQAFYVILGVPVVLLSLIQLFGVVFTIPQRHRVWAEWAVGVVSGFLGGVVGTWGPTTVLYLMAVDTPKARQLLVQGVIYGTGSVALFAGHLQSGVLNAQTWAFSVALMAPAFLGMLVGFRVSDRMSLDVFRKITLIVLLIAGLNMLRKAFIG